MSATSERTNRLVIDCARRGRAARSVRALLRAAVSLGAGAALVAVGAAAAPAPLRAQGNTAETLAGAVKLYEDLQVERAVALLRQVISPSSPYEVSREQRVEAYKYLGASLAVLGMRDSAVVYLRAAIERDPFADLDARSFTEVERSAFLEARNRTFALAARSVTAARIDPRTEHLNFAVLTTHAAALQAEVRPLSAGAAGGSAVLFEGENDGLREVTWAGVLGDGRLAPPGRYALVLAGRSARTGRADSTRVYFDIRHDREALEDTLPTLGAADLLPERHANGVAARDLLKGLGVAGAAMLMSGAVSNGRLGSGSGYAGAAAGAGAVAGVGAFVFRQRHRDIPANIAVNRRRLAERAQRNAEIVQRNAGRVALTRLVVAPAAGAGQ